MEAFLLMHAAEASRRTFPELPSTAVGCLSSGAWLGKAHGWDTLQAAGDNV